MTLLDVLLADAGRDGAVVLWIIFRSVGRPKELSSRCPRQGVCRRTHANPIHAGNYLTVSHIKIINERRKMIQTKIPAFSTRVAVAILFFAFVALGCPLQRRHHERYSQISAVLMSVLRSNCRELPYNISTCLKSACCVSYQRVRGAFFVAAGSTTYTYML